MNEWKGYRENWFNGLWKRHWSHCHWFRTDGSLSLTRLKEVHCIDLLRGHATLGTEHPLSVLEKGQQCVYSLHELCKLWTLHQPYLAQTKFWMVSYLAELMCTGHTRANVSTEPYFISIRGCSIWRFIRYYYTRCLLKLPSELRENVTAPQRCRAGKILIPKIAFGSVSYEYQLMHMYRTLSLNYI